MQPFYCFFSFLFFFIFGGFCGVFFPFCFVLFWWGRTLISCWIWGTVYHIFYSCVWIYTQKFRIWITDAVFLKHLFLRGLKKTGRLYGLVSLRDLEYRQNMYVDNEIQKTIFKIKTNTVFQYKYKYKSWILYLVSGVIKLLLISMWD